MLVPAPDTVGEGKLVYFFGDWTEISARETHHPKTAWEFVERWVRSGAVAQPLVQVDH